MALPNLENFRYIPLKAFDHGKSIAVQELELREGPMRSWMHSRVIGLALGGAASFVLIRDRVDDPLARRFA